MNEEKFVLGLDISTNTIGFALFTIGGKLSKLTHLSPKPKNMEHKKPKELSRKEMMFDKYKTEELIHKSQIFREFLRDYKHLNIVKVIIEEPLLNSNNIYTVGTLIRFNGMITDVVYQELGVISEYITTSDARQYAFPELLAPARYKKNNKFKPIQTRNKPVLFGAFHNDVDKKYIIWKKVSKKEPNIEWVINKNGNLAKENFDSADAYTCVLGHMRKLNIW